MKIETIGTLKSGAAGDSFARAALCGNFLYRHTNGGVIALGEDGKTVYLMDRNDDAPTDAVVRIWQERLNLGKEEK